jgi:hypothetical protein
MPKVLQVVPLSAAKHPSADIDRLARELEQAVATDAVVEVPAVLPTQIESTTLYVRPKACAVWMFAELSDEEAQSLPTGNWLVDLLRANQQRQGGRGDQ